MAIKKNPSTFFYLFINAKIKLILLDDNRKLEKYFNEYLLDK